MVLRSCAFLLALTVGLVASTSPAGRIPEVHAVAFSGDAVNFPQSLQGHTTVFLIGFTKDSRDAVTLWARRLAADYQTSPTVLYYEVAVLAGVPRVLRGLVTRRIKDTVPARAQPRFVPIYDQEDAWKAAADFPRQGPENDAYLLIVDGSGNVRVRFASGPPTDQTYANLKHQLEAIKP